MCDCLPSSPLSFTVTKFRQLGFCRTNQRPQSPPHPYFYIPNCLKLSNFTNLDITGLRNGRSLVLCRRASENPSEDFGFGAELGFKEKRENLFDLEAKPSDAAKKNGIDPTKEGNASLGSDFLQSEGGLGDEKQSTKTDESLENENWVRMEGADGDGLENEEGLKHTDGKVGLRKGRQVMRRSNILAKQVISIRSALSLGFVSQLWVNTNSWMVMFVEVKRNLLSGESERFLLDDITQVGDVVLVEDESVVENEFKIAGLETLVGYQVVTPGRRTMGKVRGYSFNINSGAVESLELDSFGISIIPSSLVSTYALFVEDVLEVVSDAVIVHEAAASRIHRLTKGFLDSQNVATSLDELDEYSDFERPARSDKHTRRSFGNQKFNSRKSKTNDDWDLPMDYF
ncbi:hypothetical protein PRUPE_6G295400 [Prunus persica]|uniref:PRC-barrel domain-containing protein n=1 Tax=Prunus persica TaxID=3760 RepID=M5WB55_PRUPE|nr:uncharacterized protein LOC18772892 [Prunus persica]ONI03988.1 hypothetical protein PRUPE_6G295400 [Prunus persica]